MRIAEHVDALAACDAMIWTCLPVQQLKDMTARMRWCPLDVRLQVLPCLPSWRLQNTITTTVYSVGLEAE
jgi:hypothetical protein